MDIGDVQFLAKTRMCVECEQFGTLASNEGIVCYYCENFYHKTCIDPVKQVDDWPHISKQAYECEHCECDELMGGRNLSESDSESDSDGDSLSDDFVVNDDVSVSPTDDHQCMCDLCRAMRSERGRDMPIPRTQACTRLDGVIRKWEQHIADLEEDKSYLR